MAYGDYPPPGSGIPKGATLIYDIELLRIDDEGKNRSNSCAKFYLFLIDN